MKWLSGTILLCFLIWFGWARYDEFRKEKAAKVAQAEAKKAKEERENREGYERCIQHEPSADNETVQKQREACQQFWFSDPKDRLKGNAAVNSEGKTH